ncbi:ABC transporter permease [Candidatus Shapirobacteria bacterium CG03_land_8_20_14_0_80_40_19]|uniref:ABC transporter permease n=1 Tax=Candidatus Shapirobacteria bacterium CG03_land_8_20_14_0_80_40_19 TaxID=1974880 RepID=A0A2M7BF99_9BACT|nr:MAG: ABC transporter permease [Candidatus Shapirobacteria bacterium CG03_land_8_20_14_0_80_40_19]
MLKPTITELLKTSLRSILKNKGRTALTSLGIIIGVTSVILLTSIGNGLKNYIAQQFESLGSNLIYVLPGKVFNESGGFGMNAAQGLLSTSFSQKDIQNLKKNLDTVNVVIGNVELAGKAKYRNKKEDVTIVATGYEYGKVSNTIPKEGKGVWFSKEDEAKKANVGVLGADSAEKLFGNENPLGKTVIINSKNIKIIGVAEKKGGGLGAGHLDETIYVPLEVGFSFAGNRNIQSILLQTKNKEEIDLIKKQTEKIMLKNFEEDEFSVADQSQILSSINSILGTLTIALSGIAAISLIVGGIGIMNIMIATVTERTREIGLRKAVGATPRAILLQFLFEAVILSCLGGLIGVLLGGAITQAINQFFPAKVTFISVFLAFGVSFAVGIIFGVTPARRASKLSPIEALRYE